MARNGERSKTNVEKSKRERVGYYYIIRGGCLFEAGRLLNFAILSKCSMFILQKTINGNNKKRRCNKVRFL